MLQVNGKAKDMRWNLEVEWAQLSLVLREQNLDFFDLTIIYDEHSTVRGSPKLEKVAQDIIRYVVPHERLMGDR